MTDTKAKANLPDLVEVDLKSSSYQPSKAVMDEEIDMPGWSFDQVRETFMRPFMAKES